jgi:hypothetical protein
VKLTLQILIPLLAWLSIAWFVSDGFKEPSETRYAFLMLLGLIASAGVIGGFVLFLSWLY